MVMLRGHAAVVAILLALSVLLPGLGPVDAQDDGEAWEARPIRPSTERIDDEGVTTFRERERFNVAGFRGRALFPEVLNDEVRAVMNVRYEPPNGTGSDYVLITPCEDVTRGFDNCFNRSRWDPSGAHGKREIRSVDNNRCVFDSRDGDPFYSRVEIWRGNDLQGVAESDNKVLPYSCD